MTELVAMTVLSRSKNAASTPCSVEAFDPRRRPVRSSVHWALTRHDASHMFHIPSPALPRRVLARSRAPTREGSMLICFWSPKGGSGTSVVAAAAALVMAREGSVRLADLSGDQPGIFGVADPATGLRDWLRLGPEAPVDALERVAVDAAPRVSLLPSGTADVAPALPEAGAALAVALAQDARPTVVDACTLSPGSVPPAVDASLEVAEASVIVIRGCYLALRRAVRLDATAGATGAVL